MLGFKELFALINIGLAALLVYLLRVRCSWVRQRLCLGRGAGLGMRPQPVGQFCFGEVVCCGGGQGEHAVCIAYTG